MAEQPHPTHATVEVEPAHGADHGAPNPLEVDGPMVLWTWITFGLVAIVLYKVAWKPILAGLDKREEFIRKSLEEAEEIERRLADIKNTQDDMIAEADDKAKEIVAQSRKAAAEAARVIENKAKEETKIMAENAQREIHAAQKKAEDSLRRESAELAVALAGKILGEKLDSEKQKALADRMINEL